MKALRTRSEILRLNVDLGQLCPYYLGENIAEHFGDYLRAYGFDRVAVVAGHRPYQLFGGQFTEELSRSGIANFVVLIEDNEGAKNWATLSSLCESLLEGGITRDSIVIGFGGGVLGNMAGLAAGMLYRGIRYVEVPTTMTAQTDSALSRKQAINGLTGKNLFGLYHTPVFIWSDVSYLKTEPLRQTRAAIVESIKNGLVNNPLWLAELSARLEPGLPIPSSELTEFIRLLVESKLDILKRDPTEQSDAIILEYGHTFGHAIEWLSRGELYHGEAVSIGMCVEAHLSHMLGIMSEELLTLHYHLLGEVLGAPVRLPSSLRPRDIYATMLNDNKRNRAGLTCLLLKEAGCVHRVNGSYLTPIGEADAMLALEAARTGILCALAR